MRAWWFRANGDRRGTVIYLHGIADNRGSSVRIAEHFVPMGFDVVAYDSRAHGQSTGSACSYGVHEKRDLMRVMDQVDHVAQGPIVVLGTSLGAAVALQAAAADERIAAVVSVATFSDLRTVVAERAPFFASRNNVAQAFAIAERDAAFNVDEASPVAAAPNIRAPVLVIHGARDSETPPEHSRRVFAALKSEKRLVVVPDAGHNDCLKPAVWREIDAWLVAALAKGRAPS
ncbi:MAG TPA: alpha/beta fold hydrolase [Polyangia bacterium]